MKILLIYYSQSGEAERIAEVIIGGLRSSAVELTVENLQPRTPYPFPWKSIGNFFNVLPECHWGPPPALLPVRFDPDKKFDLVILIYQVWFLAPSLPIQGFLKSEAARVLQDTKVLTVSISRNMWQSASETMKRLLAERRARHIDNAVLTHQGPVWATFVTTPRALLFGKKEGFWRVFPAAGLGPEVVNHARQFGKAVVDQKEKLLHPNDEPLLRGLGAVNVDVRYVLAERAGWYCFRFWGRLILLLGRFGSSCRKTGVYLFVFFLVCMIPIGIPITMLVRLVFRPFLGGWMRSYTAKLRQPSET
jgi:hypothetical protein